ncbi:MAG: glycoside hydrolase family protein, partial [Gammaproteobacteria bacterium]|nr:glycoside hydrolase family protein [Gammaproteobacteria bacterium]
RVALEKHDASKSVNATKLVGTIAKLVGTGSIAAAVIAAKNSRAQLSYSPSLLKTSKNGLNHLYKTESLKNISNRLHWPGGGSGVTLGPGYDMKERSETEIVKAMLAISLDNKLATSISKAAGLEKQAAKTFAKNNKKLVKLNKQQEIKLLTNIVPTYEKLVKNLIKVDLTQHEFDALVSFAYNPGGRLATVCRFINQGEIAKAMNNIKKAITSGGKIMGGLIKRRDKEVNMYLYSDYGK